MNLFLSQFTTPLGDMLLVTDDSQVVRALDFADHRPRLLRGVRQRFGNVVLADAPAPGDVVAALTRYFNGDVTALDSLNVLVEGTELQQRVWTALRAIPAGTTISYGKLAKSLGFEDPRAAIDIGAANKANPVAVIIPCHRVIASDGGLKGYAWGLHRKRWLLEHEKALPTAMAPAGSGVLPGMEK